jgi:hypothetical protein
MDLRPCNDPVEPATVRSSTSSGGVGRLGFVALVTKHFAFLLRLGCAVVRREDTFVRFESDTVFVNVYHGRSSYQVGLELGRIQESEKYSLYEVLSAVAPGDLQRARCQTTDPDVLGQCLAAIADTVEQNCKTLLAGDPAAFEHLRSVVSPMRQAATIQAQFGAIIDRADRAWDAKDLERAAALYEKAIPGLDETRTRRLQYLHARRAKDSEK